MGDTMLGCILEPIEICHIALHANLSRECYGTLPVVPTSLTFLCHSHASKFASLSDRLLFFHIVLESHPLICQPTLTPERVEVHQSIKHVINICLY